MTSKNDNPPPYEDAVQQPKHGNYPQQPESLLPQPPSYSPSAGMCPPPPSYWSQEGVYPQAGMWAAPGLPPSGAPTTIPTLSAAVPASNQGSEGNDSDNHTRHCAQISSQSVRSTNHHCFYPHSAGEMDDFVSYQWENTSIRHAFIRKVSADTSRDFHCVLVLLKHHY